MPIGLDLDDTLAPLFSEFAKFLNNKYNLDLSEESFADYNYIWKSYTSFRETWDKDIDEFYTTKEFSEIKPFPEAVELVKKLKTLDDLLIITSRPNSLIEKTNKFISENFPGYFSKIEFENSYGIGEKFSKRELCRKNNIWLMVEDAPTHALEVSNEMPVILPNKPWNQGVRHENILRAYNLNQVYDEAVKLDYLI